jgi:hypothetical protein
MAVRISGSIPGVVAKLKALRGPGESYSDVILRMARGGTAMSDDKADDIDAGLPRWTEPPLTPVERQRRVVRLCCSFMRNLAFHRAGMQGEVQFNLFAPTHPQGAFWREAHGNFIDICVLDWCKLFADPKGKHHWRRVIDEPDRFKADLCATLGVTVAEFATLITQVRRYRDSFVAHLDNERMMRLPTLELPKRSIAFLHERLPQEARSYEDWEGLPTTAEQLDQGFTCALHEAQSVYAEALARHRA